MKKIIRPCLLFLILGMAGAPFCLASEIYTTESSEFLVRAGKGTDFKIVATVGGGTALELLESAGDYSRVRLSDGKEGFILTRYLTADKPASQRLAEVEAALEKARASAGELSETNSRMSVDNNDLAARVRDITQRAEKAEKELAAVKEECSEALTTRQELDRVREEAARDRLRAEEAESRVARLERSTSIYWFLSGAGVLFLGLILGSINRKKRQRSSLLR